VATGSVGFMPGQMLNEYAAPEPSVRPQLQDVPRARHHGYVKPLLFAAKLIVSAACFWLVFRRIDVDASLRALPTVDYRWAAFAVLAIVAELPLLALRLQTIVQSLAGPSVRLTYPAANAVTAIYSFFGQVVPGLVGEGIRAWLLVRHGCSWRAAVTSVTIDRGTGVVLLVAFSFVILLLPSPLNTLSGYRDVVLVAFGGALLAGVLVLLLAPGIVSLLRRWRYFAWVASLIDDTHRVLLGRQAPKILGASVPVHALSIVAVWALGHALGLSLSVYDSAVLFTVMVGVAIVPISIGGWGLRELAVVSLLGAHGLAPEQALLFSLCFGFIFVAVGLLGAIVWLLYPLPGKAPPASRVTDQRL
jgi:glycosyltransferase 2 family protein